MRPGAAPPLRGRPLDAVIVAYFVMYWFAVMVTDLHNFTASALGLTVEQLVGRGLPWPPPGLSRMYLIWARAADPLLLENPPLFQAMEWVNLVLLMPFALMAVYAFARGLDFGFLRGLGLLLQAFTFYSVLLCVGGTVLIGSGDLLAFLVVYAPFLVMPAVVWARLYAPAPFAPETLLRQRRLHRALLWVAAPLLGGSLIYQGLWLFRHV
jgi:hypothetical protein